MLLTKRHIYLLLLTLLVSLAQAQDIKPLQVILPNQPGWTNVPEGNPLRFEVKTNARPADTLQYAIAQGKLDGMELDSLGQFSWTPDYNLASRIQTTRIVSVILEVSNQRGEKVTQSIDFKVQHVNRPPMIDELRPFYVRYRAPNSYKIDADEQIYDDDDDPLVFIPIADQMPEGAKLSAQGELTWTLSLSQFNRLKDKPYCIEFWVEDQPAKLRTKGRLKIDVTQMD